MLDRWTDGWMLGWQKSGHDAQRLPPKRGSSAPSPAPADALGFVARAGGWLICIGNEGSN